MLSPNGNWQKGRVFGTRLMNNTLDQIWHQTADFSVFTKSSKKKEEDFFLSGTMPIEKEDGWQYSTCQVATVSVTKMTHYKYKTLWCNMQVHSLIISHMCELIRPPSVAPEWPRHSLWLMRICDFRFFIRSFTFLLHFIQLLQLGH